MSVRTATGFVRKFNAKETHLAQRYPGLAMRSMVAREAVHNYQFNYNVAQSDNLRGKSGGETKHGSAETYRGNRDRIELMWQARDAERNQPLLWSVIEKCVNYTVPKLIYVPDSGDDKWDQACSAYFNETWAPECDLTKKSHFREFVELTLRSWLRDGDCGVNIVKKVEPKLNDVGQPIKDGNGNAAMTQEIRLQGIEADLIGSVQNEQANENVFAGVRVDPETGAPTHYEIYKRTRNNMYEKDKDLPADQFIHLYRPLRFGEYRGRSWLAPALADARDLHEMFGCEKQAAKFAASFTAFIRTRSDTPDGVALFSDKVTQTGEKVMEAQAGKIIRTDDAENIQFAPASPRPSGAFIALIEAMTRQIANSLNLPYAFIWDLSRMGGVSARLESRQADRVFKGWQRRLEEKLLNRVRDVVIANAIAMGKLPANKNWKKGKWRFGEWITADVGNESNARIMELNAGILTETQILEERDMSFDEIQRIKAAETQTILDIAKAAELPAEAIRPDRSNLTQLAASMEDAKNPKPPQDPGITSSNPKAAKDILDLLRSVGEGLIPRETAVANLMAWFGLPLDQAERMVPPAPEPQPSAMSMPESMPESMPQANPQQ
jgi:lambda family phage portal protein